MIRVSLIILLLVSFVTISNMGCTSSPATITVTTTLPAIKETATITPPAITETVTITPTEQGIDTPVTSVDIFGDSKEIIIKYSAVALEPAVGNQRAATGYVYLIVHLEIENNGYELFNTHPSNFKFIHNNVKYNNTLIPVENELKALDVLNKGRVSGNIAFEVPDTFYSLFFGLLFGDRFVYEHPSLDYVIKWIEETN